MKKRILFFDADGTLWYPKETRRSKNPIWIHIEKKNIQDIRKELILVPNVISTLKKLKSINLEMIVLSVSPLPPREAQDRLEGTLKYFGILHFFDEVHATKPYPESKGEYMLEIIKRYGLKKSEALMIGDIYLWDFSSAKKVGIKAALFEHNYDPKPHHYKKVKLKLEDFKEVLNLVRS
jgi:FMN phosphatase YigB (HAD superfamily)